LAPDLAAFAWLPVAIAIPLPAITVITSLQRALLVVQRVTRPISWATGVEVAGIAGALFVLTRCAGWIGAVAAVTAMVVGRSAAMVYLMPKVARSVG
jgi:O-antigen/teichoic acid export membrane protein